MDDPSLMYPPEEYRYPCDLYELTYDQTVEYVRLEIENHPAYENGYPMNYKDDPRHHMDKSKSAQACDTFRNDILVKRVGARFMDFGYRHKFVLHRKFIDENLQINHSTIGYLMYSNGNVTQEEKLYLKMRWAWNYV